MLDNGNFVLYNSESSIIWQSFDYPTDTLLQGQRLRPGSGLFSNESETDHSKGIFTLPMQTDDNLVQYPVSIQIPMGLLARWSKRAMGVRFARFCPKSNESGERERRRRRRESHR
ncbi:hypothetical protein ACS0TY_032586 [Phlomoides rotata]